MSPLPAAARRYAAAGWLVLPLHDPRSGGGCSCGKASCPSKGKHPRTARGLHKATTDPEAIDRWWHRWPDANVGLRTGPESGLLVIDIDHPDGFGSWAKLEATHGAVMTTEAETGSGGAHLYLRYPAGGSVGNSAGKLGEGLDVRASGGYVVAPPSRHPSGGTYRWCNAAYPLLDCPGWLLDLLCPPKPVRTVAHPPRRLRGRSYVIAAVTAELDELRHATPGTRNATLNSAAFSLYQLVGSHGADEQGITDRLEATALAIGLGSGEVRATLASARRSAQEKPRGVAP